MAIPTIVNGLSPNTFTKAGIGLLNLQGFTYKIMDLVELSYVTIQYKEPIIYLTFKAGAELGFPEMQELVSHSEKLSNNKNYFVLSDAREIVGVTPEGKKYSSETKNSPLQKGTAVLVKNNFLKLAANFFFGVKVPEYPFQAFTEKQKAEEWLLSLPLDQKLSSQ